MALAPGALPPTILDLHTPVVEENPDRPIHANLFADDEEFGYSDDDDEEEEKPEVIVGRTRLNFNSVMSPDREVYTPRPAGMFFVPFHCGIGYLSFSNFVVVCAHAHQRITWT
jgi:hypothetical protein